jgi:acyl carrier protein
MSEQEARSIIRDYIVSTWLSGDARGFDDETDLAQAGILDSFSTLDVAAFLGQRFGIVLEPIEINTESFRNVGSLARTVLGKRAATQAA